MATPVAVVAAVAVLNPSASSCKRDFARLIAPLGHPEVPPPPSRQIRHIIRSAPDTLRGLRALLEPQAFPEGDHDGLL